MGIPIADGRRLYVLTERMHAAGDPDDSRAAVLTGAADRGVRTILRVESSLSI